MVDIEEEEPKEVEPKAVELKEAEPKEAVRRRVRDGDGDEVITGSAMVTGGPGRTSSNAQM